MKKWFPIKIRLSSYNAGLDHWYFVKDKQMGQVFAMWKLRIVLGERE